VHNLDARRLLVLPHVEQHMQEVIDLRIVNQLNSNKIQRELSRVGGTSGGGHVA
jgi:hypothetical protein